MGPVIDIREKLKVVSAVEREGLAGRLGRHDSSAYCRFWSLPLQTGPAMYPYLLSDPPLSFSRPQVLLQLLPLRFGKMVPYWEGVALRNLRQDYG